MFTIEVALKSSPATFSVQRKNAEDAEALYAEILGFVRSGQPQWLDLTCEKQIGKKVSVLTSEVVAVQVSDKSGAATAGGRTAGFLAAATGAAN
jgi:hypothetical protein